ncbi:hypothetical protein KP003_20030 [Geomonas nitrogeniifigens]|uniref:hypothetical protein n=1 Tax=Geomonas diazotrophica TaxID=2843197 RepID=UPI001C2CA9A6|nr:hypothetical protein [Geomonas nitrogeniifigens]QXE86609.1 hypothetical protein KP003_20030 [Geomonas nitrogeniifigens]
MGLDNEFVDREHSIENAEYSSTVACLETDTMPLGRVPFMRSINGVGLSLYGNGDYHKETDSHVKTLYLIIFFIPFLPLKRFRVKPAGGEFYVISSESRYIFMFQLPLTTRQKIHKNAALAVLAALVLAVILH